VKELYPVLHINFYNNSLIAADNLATLHEKFTGKKLGNLPDMNAIEKALAHTFGLNLKD
jgi:hypothetical protein